MLANKQGKMNTKLYLCLVSPELLRLFAVLLRIFDSEASLLLLFGLLTLSIQFLSFQCLTNIRTTKIVICALSVVALRLGLKYCLFSKSDIWNLGIIM